MGDLARTMIVCGLVSGTQPITIMGLLVASSGAQGGQNGKAFLAGAFLVETAVLLCANLLVGGTISLDSGPGRAFVALRMAIGVALIVVGLLLRRPARKPQPEVPAALSRLQNLSRPKAFAGGALLADWQGPFLGSLAIAAADVEFRGRLASLVLYTVVASGIPIAVFVATRRSQRASDKVTSGTEWVMRNRRRLASWVVLAAGLFVAGDAAMTAAFA